MSKKLGVEIPPDSVVLSHTPYRALTEGANNLEHKNVLVTGSDPVKCRAMAEEYVLYPNRPPVKPICPPDERGTPTPKDMSTDTTRQTGTASRT